MSVTDLIAAAEDETVRTPVTVGDWLAQVQPAPPRALAEQLQHLVAAHAARPAAEVPEVFLAVGEALLQTMVASGSTSRETALTLLSVDALVTYAFEAAAADPSRIEQRAANAMRRISELAQE